MELNVESFYKTPASMLHEAMARKGIKPVYELIVDGTELNQTKFTYKVTCETAVTYGTGRSKKKAKQYAAEAMLKKLMIFYNDRHDSESSVGSQNTIQESFDRELVQPLIDDVPDEINIFNSDLSESILPNFMQTLVKLCKEHALTSPEFVTSTSGPSHAPHFTVRCTVSNFVEEGFATSKKLAKRDATQKMIERIKEMDDDNINSHENLSLTSKSENDSNTVFMSISEPNFIAGKKYLPSVATSDEDRSKQELFDKEKILSLSATKENLNQKEISNRENLPPEIEKQLAIVEKSIEKLLTLVYEYI